MQTTRVHTDSGYQSRVIVCGSPSCGIPFDLYEEDGGHHAASIPSECAKRPQAARPT